MQKAMWETLINEARRRAWATGFRYRVRYEPNNRVWYLYETVTPIDQPIPKE